MKIVVDIYNQLGYIDYTMKRNVCIKHKNVYQTQNQNKGVEL